MFYKFKKGKQKKLMQRAINIAGSERKLSKLTGIPKSSIYYLKFEKRNMSDTNTEKICAVLGIKKEDIKKDLISILPHNWGRKKGGVNLIKLKIEKGILDKTIAKLKESSSKRMKKWHRYMKKNEPEKYHIWQYERFKKIGKGYPFTLQNGIRVRNRLEKEVGDYLIKKFPNALYEPYVNINGKAYFPDFVNGNRIFEVTEWRNPTKKKIRYLKKKIKDYIKNKYDVSLFIPKKYRKFYKEIEGYIISDLSEMDISTKPS